MSCGEHHAAPDQPPTLLLSNLALRPLTLPRRRHVPERRVLVNHRPGVSQRERHAATGFTPGQRLCLLLRVAVESG